jgi:hypothetical protein
MKKSRMLAAGDVKDVARMQARADIEKVRGAVTACVKEPSSMQALGSTASADDVKTALKAAADDCDASAKEAFEKEGGDADDYAVMKMKSARANLADKGQSCIQEFPDVIALNTANCLEDAGSDADQRKACIQARRAAFKKADGHCIKEKEKAFAEAGGDTDLLFVEMENSQTLATADKMEACVKSHSDVAQLGTTSTDAQKKAAYTTACTACQKESKVDFENSGGDSRDYERKQAEASERAASDSLKTCVAEKKEDNEAGFNAATAKRDCLSNAKDTFMATGGTMPKTKDTADMKDIDFESAIAKSEVKAAGEKMASCMKAVDTSDKEKVEKKAGECLEQAKLSVKNIGGDEHDVEGMVAAASLGAISAGNFRCLQLAGTNTTNIEKCKVATEKTYKKTGGDPDKIENAKKVGAALVAKDQYRLCMAKDNSVKADCKKEAKSRFRAAGGPLSREPASANDDTTETFDEKFNTDYAKTVGIEGARREASDMFLMCMKKVLSADQVSKGVTVGEFKDAAAKCKPAAKNAFEDAGGDATVFDTEFITQVRASKSQAMSVCIRNADSDAARSVCSEKINKMASLLGEKAERRDRNKQDGASDEAASVAEACKKDAGTGCMDKAKRAFEKCGGAKESFETELRRGCGTVAVLTKRACKRKNDGSKKTGADADACLTEAKEAYKNARANTTDSVGDDHWYDAKLGALLGALDEYRKAKDNGKTDQEATDAAKTYHKDIAMADESDWHEGDFDALRKIEEKPLNLEKGPDIDVRVEMTGMTTAKMQEAKPNVEKAIKDVVETSATTGDVEKVSCSTAAASGTKQVMSCRVQPKIKSVGKGEELQAIARRPNFGSDLKTTFNNMQRRRRLNSRSLQETAATITTEASQTYSVSAWETSSTSSGATSGTTSSGTTSGTINPKRGTGASPSGSDDDEELLSGGHRSLCSAAALLVVAIVCNILV